MIWNRLKKFLSSQEHAKGYAEQFFDGASVGVLFGEGDLTDIVLHCIQLITDRLTSDVFLDLRKQMLPNVASFVQVALGSIAEVGI